MQLARNTFRIGRWSLVLTLAFGCSATISAAEDEAETGVYALESDDLGKVLKTPDGKTVFRYMTKKPEKTTLTANSVCCLYPLYTPSGERVVDFGPPDHPHHRGVFLAWHAMDCGQRADFWGWGEWAPTENRVIRNRSVELQRASERGAVIAVRNDWMIGDETVIEERLRIVAFKVENTYAIDMQFELTPKVDVSLDQTAFGGFCVKARNEGKAAYYNAKGEVELPDPHHLKPETDWPDAPWYDYTMTLEGGKTIGIGVVNHPDNPPTTWHNLRPIAMINPCIVSAGKVTVKKGETLTLRYGLAVHDGPTPVELLDRGAERFRQR
jgi:hypothetical protein